MGAELSPSTLILEDENAANKITAQNASGVLSITPAVDDVGSIVIGSATKSIDVKIFLGAADQYVLFDRGAASVTFAKLDVALSGDLAVTVEDISLGDDNDLEFGDGTDVLMRWSTADASNHALVLALSDTSQQIHITDKGAIATDWTRSAGTHPEVAIHSNTTPITDYLAIGNHDGTTAHIDVVGGTTLSLDIAGAAEVTLTASALSPATSDGNALGTATLMWADLFLASEAVINFNNGDVTLTHAANLITIGGGTVTLSDTTDASSLTVGALVVTGGIACAKQLYLGDDLDMSVSDTGTYDITLATNKADALSICDSAGDLIVFTTTTGSQSITITPATTITGLLTTTGGITNNSAGIAATGAISGATTIAASTSITVTSANASALAVGRLGATTPALVVDASTATSITGISIKSAASGGGVAIAAVGETNVALTINAAGTGTIGIGSVSTGAVTITPALTVISTLTVGADAAGTDFTLYGAVTGYKAWWDADGDSHGAFYFGADTKGVLVTYYGDTTGYLVSWNPSTDTNGTWTFGADTKGVDVLAYGATTGNYLQWDASADDLLLVGTATQLGIAGTTASTSTTTGSLRTAGGLGVVGAAWIGGGISSSGQTLTPDATRTYIAYQIGNRVTEKDITMVAAADQNLDPIQANLNIIGANPTGTSTVNMSWMNITHDTTAMANLRLKCADWNIVVAKNVQDVYAYQGEVDFSGTTTASGEVSVMGLVLDGGVGAVTCSQWRGLNVTLRGAGTPLGAHGIMVNAESGTVDCGIRLQCDSSAMGSGIRIGNDSYLNTPTNFVAFPETATAPVSAAGGTTHSGTVVKIACLVGSATYYMLASTAIA